MDPHRRAAVAVRAWRRVVPSPEPRAVLDLPAIRTPLDAGTTVVCAGEAGTVVAR